MLILGAKASYYTAFGEEISTSKLSPWRFCSKRRDEETGYLYFGRRFYAPSLGRWISPDPRGFEDGPNLYAYVHNAPLLDIDLYGEWAIFRPMCDFGYRMGSAALDFTFPCATALYRLPANAPMWQRGALAFGAVGEAALLLVPPVKMGVSLAEKSVFQIGKSAMARQTERQLMRSAGKTASVAAERKIVQKKLNEISVNDPRKFNLDALSKAGQAMDRNGLTKAGRALDKHGGRTDSVFPKATGDITNKNIQGQFHLDDILTYPNASSFPNRFGGRDVFSPLGRGARFDGEGNFMGFLQPRG